MLNKVEGVRFIWRFIWRGCISTGGGAFQMEEVRFIWRGCVSYGGCFSTHGGAFGVQKVAAVHLRMRIAARTCLA